MKSHLHIFLWLSAHFLYFTFLISSPYLEWPTEREKVKKAADHCRQILNYVNQAVKEAENKQVKNENKKIRDNIERTLNYLGSVK